MQIEIEKKIQIEPEQLEHLKNWLSQNAKFKDKLHHIEYYIDNPKAPFCFDRDGMKDADNYLRIRMTEKGDSICLKKFHPDPNRPGRHNRCDEYETSVKDGKVLLELMKEIGFTDEILIDKKRETYVYKNFEILIDEVKNAGLFVEIELKEDIDNVEGHKKIKDLLREIGITKFREQYRGYVSMLWNPDIDFGEYKEI